MNMKKTTYLEKKTAYLDTKKKTAYLDTNTLHFIGLYLERANADNLYPFKTESPDESAKRLEKTSLDGELEKRLTQGLRTLDYLKKHDLQIEYSIVSKLELITGRTRGKAIEHAAQEGIPDRMWSRFSESEVRERVSNADMKDIRERIDSIFSNIEKSDITVLGSERRVQYALELAGGISGLIHMGPIDCIIYASALVAQAACIITADGYFKGIINKIHNPNENSRYVELQPKLRDLLDDQDAALPEAFAINAKGNLEPQPLSSALK